MDLLDGVIETAIAAGRAVLDVYEKEAIEVSYKDDLSPLTEADRRSHGIIESGLASLAPDIPVFSEEGAGVLYEVRRAWRRFFLVDPLDGTKEFIKRNGEFTVNIALVEDSSPVLGVIHVPVSGVTYYAERGRGAYILRAGASQARIGVRQKPDAEGLVVVASRSHGSEALEEFLKSVKVNKRMSAGSSLKFCLVADGTADIYPRFGPTWEWDTAAGHVIVSEAGGVVTCTDGSRLEYNKEVPKHTGFIVSSPGAR